MSESTDKQDIHFYQLLISLHAAAMQQMGKVVSPITGKVERDLSQAKNTIDLLEMIQRKTEGNLDEDEKKLAEDILYGLRMNYVDEIKKGEKPEEELSKEPQQSTGEPAESQSEKAEGEEKT